MFNQEFNHALVQLYRSGSDYIGPHSDKTLDIVKGTNIINFTIGCTRAMCLKKKDGEPNTPIPRVYLSNNSVFKLGWETNRLYTHGINQDGRLDIQKSSDELAESGQRISWTFRTIGTFINRSSGEIIGQGALKNKPEEAIDDTLEMLKAFSIENKTSNFDWEKNYGCGFNSLYTKV